MPELPDLHVFSMNLKKRILNKTISSVEVFNKRIINTPKLFSDTLTGTSVQDIVRDGKELSFLLANNNCFNVHLMLKGNFYITGRDDAAKIPSKITALFFDEAPSPDESVFVIADEKGLCRITLNPKTPQSPDALSQAFTPEYFSNALRKNARKNIKAVLTDQSVVRGIGNAYADEILWKAGISPESAAGKIPEEKTGELYQAIPFIFDDAIRNIQKISPDIINGEERSFLRVHNPNKKYTDEGSKIIVKTVASKMTYFTGEQKLFI